MNLLQRIGESDQTAFIQLVEKYGDFVWSISNKLATTKEEAEMFSRKIFEYIRDRAGNYEDDKSAEKKYVAFLILRWILQNKARGFLPEKMC